MKPKIENYVKYSVFLIDDSPDLRILLEEITTRLSKEFKTIGSCSTIEESITPLLELRPDIVVVDHMLPGIRGLDGIVLLKPKLPNTVFLLRTYLMHTHDATEVIEDAILKGADFVTDYGPVRPQDYLQSLRDVVRIYQQRLQRD